MRISDHELNRLRLLKAIRRAEPVARTDLVNLTGLAAGTVSEVTSDMVKNGLLLEEKAPVIKTGRPRMKLRINPDAAFVVGALLLPSGVLETVVTNLRGDLLFSQSVALTYTKMLANMGDQIADAIDATIEASPISKTEIARVGIGLPGVIDSGRGVLHWLQTFPLEPLPMAEMVGARLGLPTSIDNNANIVARAEHWFGEGEQLDDFCLIMLGYGLGFAQYSGGMLWRSVGGLNPEFGHLKIAIDGGRMCSCGASGCLAAYSTIHAIVAQICEGRNVAVPPFLEVDELFERSLVEAQAGDAIARAAFARAGQALGMAVANYTNFWDPKRIIVMCMREGLVDLVSSDFHTAFAANVLPALSGRTDVEFRLASEERFAKGSAALVLEQLYRVAKDRLLIRDSGIRQLDGVA